jgi:hypothetical protein
MKHTVCLQSGSVAFLAGSTAPRAKQIIRKLASSQQRAGTSTHTTTLRTADRGIARWLLAIDVGLLVRMS